jgi:transcriptional regulator with XRE-family HTH domain
LTGRRMDGELGAIIGKNLRAARAREGMALKELAAHIGLSASYVSQVENGYVKTPGIGPLYTWASALGVRMEDLMELPRIEHTSKGRRRAKDEYNERQREYRAQQRQTSD